ncbi:MAG: heavy metal-associated domain-containing protein, partial [Eubacteriales bacterium]|nr:heavy metal-associated domain-containing protein [Eubacteriales bacterium]
MNNINNINTENTKDETGESGSRTATIQIGGMTCAACARRIENAISRENGISGVSVNLATEK